MTLKVRFRHFLTTHVNIFESQIKKLFFFYWFFLLKSSPLLTHVLKTPLLRSHCNMYLNFLLNLKKKPKHICGQVLIPIQVVLLLIHILHMSKAQRIYNRDLPIVPMFLPLYSVIEFKRKLKFHLLDFNGYAFFYQFH